MTWGQYLPVLKQRAARGEPVPALETWPRPWPLLLPVLRAFWELSETRPVGWAPSAIPLTEILAYLDVVGIRDPDERADWVRLLRDLDREWLTYQAQQEQKPKGGS